MTNQIHKTKEREGGDGIRKILYGGYVAEATHRIEHYIKEYSPIYVSYLWKNVSCKKCLRKRGKK